MSGPGFDSPQLHFRRRRKCGDVTQKNKVSMRTDDELKTLAKDIVMGKAFLDRHLAGGNEDLFGSAFLPPVFLDDGQRAELIEISACIYEYMDKAVPRSINGFPMFMSFGYLTHAEWEKVVEYGKKVEEALASV